MVDGKRISGRWKGKIKQGKKNKNKTRKVGKADTVLSLSNPPPAGWSSLSLMGASKTTKWGKKIFFALTSLTVQSSWEQTAVMRKRYGSSCVWV